MLVRVDVVYNNVDLPLSPFQQQQDLPKYWVGQQLYSAYPISVMHIDSSGIVNRSTSGEQILPALCIFHLKGELLAVARPQHPQSLLQKVEDHYHGQILLHHGPSYSVDHF